MRECNYRVGLICVVKARLCVSYLNIKVSECRYLVRKKTYHTNLIKDNI